MLGAAFLCGALFLISGCFKKASPAAKADAAVVATVNGDSITAQEVKRELALRAKQDPRFKVGPETLQQQLDLMVDQKLLIQEAIRRKISEEEQFARSIRTFWEQSLVRVLMDRLSKDFEETAFATEAEVQEYYGKLNSRVVFEVTRGPNRQVLETLAENAKSGTAIHWQEKIGPVGYENINSDALAEAFALPAGAYQVIESAKTYYLVHVVSKEAVSPPPIDQIRDKIMTKIKQHKQRAAFENWMKEKRTKSRIKINLNHLTEGGKS